MADDDEARPSLLDVVCYAPLGLAQVASEELPKLVRQRRQAAENRIQLARWIGQIAVQQANRELRKRWSAAHPAAPSTAAPSTGTSSSDGSREPGGAADPSSAAASSARPGGSIDEVVTVGWSPEGEALVGGTDASMEDVEPAGSDTAAAPDGVPDADDLPIAGYESLAAQQVVHRLATLSADEREAIRRFEAAHRHRRTILAKLDQLQAG